MVDPIVGWPDLALNRLQLLLEEYLITSVDEEDPSRASQVILGTLQDDPIDARIWVEIYENDPDKEGWHHQQVVLNRNEDAPQYSMVIGRTRFHWLRRFTLKLNLFLEDVTREEAAGIRGSVIHRIEQMVLDRQFLEDSDNEPLSGSANERSLKGTIARTSALESGSRTDVVIWRGKFWLEYETQRRR